MKAKRNIKRLGGAKAKLLLVFMCLITVVVVATAKGNEPETIIGYKYDSGSTVWDMASRHCPDNMDIRKFVREIEEINEIKNSVVYKDWVYKIPVYKTESEYLDMNTIVGYEASDDGVLLLTSDGHGYFIEK